MLDLSGLTSWLSTSDYYYESSYRSTLSVTQGALVNDENLTALAGVDVTLGGAAEIAVSQWQSLTDGSLDVTSANYSPTSSTSNSKNSFASLTDIDGSSLYVLSGSLTLPDITSYQPAADSYEFYESAVFFETKGTNSTLSLPGLSSIGSSYSYFDNALTIEAQDGGQVDLASLTSIIASYYNAPVSVESDGSGSVIDLSSLSTYDVGGYGSDGAVMSALTGGAIELSSQLTSLEGVVLKLDGSGTIPIDQFTGITGGGIDITGGNYSPTSASANSNNSFTNLSNIDGSSLFISGGSLTLLEVTSYQAAADSYDYSQSAVSFDATGPNSTLSLPALSSIGATYSYSDSPLTIEAEDGGHVELAALVSINTSDYDAPVSVESSGSGSLIDLSSLSTYNVADGGYDVGVMSALTGGAIELSSQLTSLEGVALELDGSGTIPIGQFTGITSGGIDITSGNYSPTSAGATSSNSFTNLSNINGSSLYISGGSLTLPDVTGYQANNDPNIFSQDGNLFEATGLNSSLSLPGLSSINESNSNDAPLAIDAEDGAQVLLAALTSINASGYDTPVSIVSHGAGSLINVSALTSYDVANYYGAYNSSVLSATDSGTIELSSQLTSLDGVILTLDGTGTISISQLTSITNGGITIEAGDYATGTPLANVTDIDGSSLVVYGGGSLDLPGVQSFTSDDNSFQAEEYTNSAGSVGMITLPSLSTIGGNSLSVVAYGSGSEIGLPVLASFDAGSLSVTDDGVVVAPKLTALAGVDVTLDGTGTIATSQWQSLTNGSLTVTGGNYSSTTSPPFLNLSDIDGSSVVVYGGGSLTLPAVTTYTNTDGYEYLQAVEYTDYDYTTQNYDGYGSTGVLSLPALTAISGDYVIIVAAGTGSEIDLAALTSFDDDSFGSLSVTSNATVEDGDLASLNDVWVALDGTGIIATSQWQSLTNGSLTVTGGNYSSTTSPPFLNLSDIDGSSVVVFGGGSLNLPAVTTYTNSNGDTYLRSAEYTEFNYTTQNYDGYGSTGVLDLPALTAISGDYVIIVAAGTGSEIDLPVLTSFDDNSYGSLSVTSNATIEDGDLTSLADVWVALDGTGTIATSQWQSLTDGSLTITSGNYSSTTSPPFLNLSDIDGSSVAVSGGGSLTLPAVTTYTNSNGYEYLQASEYTDYDYATQNYDGYGSTGVLSLPSLTAISGDYVIIVAAGTGSEIDLPVLTTLDFDDNGYVSVTNQATLDALDLSSLTNVVYSTDPTASVTVVSGQSLSFPTGTSTINTGTVVDQGSVSVGNDQSSVTANISGGLTVSGNGALFVGPGSTLNVSGALLGDTTNAGGFNVLGTVVLDGDGTSDSPQEMEVMSQDLGDTPVGFDQNFVYSTLELANDSYVQLVDQNDGAPRRSMSTT